MTSRIARNDYAPDRPCLHCEQPLPSPSGVGRPRQYCGDACGRAARRAKGNQPALRPLAGQTGRIAAEYARSTQKLLDRALAGDALIALGMLAELSAQTEGLLRDALIQQARHNGATAGEMAARMGVSTTVFARRYTAAAVNRRLTSPMVAPAEIYPAAHEISLPSRQGALPTDPALRLAQALSGLVEHAQKGRPGERYKTRQELARKARVHASYLSRVITGKRRPTWATTQRITAACDGDAFAIRSLWEAAAYSGSTQEATPTGPEPQRPSTLQDLLRGLFLAASQPTEWEISRRGGGNVKDIQDILEGRVVSWDAVAKFCAALGVDPSTAQPLWTVAHTSEPGSSDKLAPAANDRDQP